MNCPVLLQYPDQIISNTKVVRNTSTTPDTSPSRVSDVHDTSGMIPPPVNPCPVITGAGILPRMNSRSEHRTLYNVRATVNIALSCLSIVVMLAVYLLFLPPFNPR